jgi:phosphomethylpyrimidine synthase
MTQLSLAREGIITDEMKNVAEDEGYTPDEIRKLVASGHAVIPKNINRDFSPKGIGRGLKTKVNANIGTSMDHLNIDEEMDKLKTALIAGTDSVMDLSTGGDLREIRKMVLDNSCVMVGAVPIYAVAAELASQDKPILHMSSDMLFESIERQCEQGIDYITVHCGVTQRSYELASRNNRIAGIVSRGGSLLSAWMHHHKRENPLYEEYDRLLNIAFKYDVTLSLGDGLRPGAIADASDKAQIEELIIIGELTKRARDAGVQVIVEGPGHVPLHQIEANMLLQKSLCDGAPFYVLGPLTTDCAPGYDHITGAIGGAIAAAYGADFLCYVTPAEHLCLPTVEDVRLGVISAKIAAHSGDIAKGVRGALERDIEMSKHRKALNWEEMYNMAIDPHVPRQRRANSEDKDKTVCTMCGKLCAVDIHNTII